MRPLKSALVLPILLGLSASQAQAAQPNHLVINPTYGSTITNDTTNAATIEATIQSAINVYQTTFSNPITVNIDFEEMTSGLGQSQTSLGKETYSDYRQALINDKQGHDTAFLSFLPAANDPNYSGQSVLLTTADLRTLGFTNYGTPAIDSTISINTLLTNNSRTGTQNGNKYDLMAVVSHEIDEALGLNSRLNINSADPFFTNTIGSLDLFRYSSQGTRSFTTSSGATSYFSTDGGTTKIVYFNQVSGADYQDWYSSDGNPNDLNPSATLGPAQVQDAFGTPGSHPNLGSSEITALQVVGYNLSAPEPSQLAALGVGAVGLVGMVLKARRRRVVSA